MTKKGEKFELDRQHWTTYPNFKIVHDGIALEMVDSGIAVELEEFIWKDENGFTCAENKSCGFQVAHDIDHPSYFLMAYKAGRNLNQNADGRRGGVLLAYDRGATPKKQQVMLISTLPF